MARRQLIALAYTSRAIEHRIANGRLHRVFRGVYAVGRPELSQHGRWLAAVLACGENAALSHHSAAALWELLRPSGGPPHVSVPLPASPTPRGVHVHRRRVLDTGSIRTHHRIPVTSPTVTLVDIAPRISNAALARAVNNAATLDLATPDDLRAELEHLSRRRGVARLRGFLDGLTFVLTESELERMFLPLVATAGLPKPQTKVRLNGFKVDFFWPELGLVVETDSLRFHRTPAQQQRDRLRDQAHTAAGLTALRFTHAQVAHDHAHVVETLALVARRLRPELDPGLAQRDRQ